MAKNTERKAARKLRQKGMAIKKIAGALSVSPGSVHRWCRDIEITDEQAREISAGVRTAQQEGLRKANQRHREKAAKRASEKRQEGRALVGALTERDLLMLGLGLYFGDGSKRQPCSVGLSNMEPVAHRLFIKWLGCCGVDTAPLRITLHIAPGHNIERAKKWWEDQLGLPVHHTVVKQSPTGGKRTQRTEYHGVLSVMLHQTASHHLIMGMLSQALTEKEWP